MKVSRVFLSSCAILAIAVVASAADRPKTSVKGVKRAPYHAPQGGVLLDQTGQFSGQGWTSQDFEAAFNAYDNQGADDFVVPAPGWSINEVVAPGFNQGIPVPAMNIQFFSNGAGIPGAVICNYANIPTIDDGLGNTNTVLPAPCVLPAGTHWVSVQARMDFGTSGQWFWGGSLSANGAPGKWQNPGGGFGTPCTTWGDLSSCIAGDNEWAWQLMGVVVPVELQGFSVE